MATFAEQVVTVLEARILELVGVQETGGDGEKTVMQDLEKKHAYWSGKVAREQGKRPVTASVDMS